MTDNVKIAFAIIALIICASILGWMVFGLCTGRAFENPEKTEQLSTEMTDKEAITQLKIVRLYAIEDGRFYSVEAIDKGIEALMERGEVED